MFMTHLKTSLVKAATAVFDADYPEPQFQTLHVSIEYPIDRQNYPGIWVDFDITQPLRIAGIGHREEVEDTTTGNFREVMRWRFAGIATFTLVALSSFERDRLFDEMVKVIAFAEIDDERAAFRVAIEENPYVASSGKFDEIPVGGFTTAPGTPWGTDDFIYEATIRLEMIGEFVSNPSTAELVPLSEIKTYVFEENDPAFLTTEGDGNGAWV